MDHHLNAAAPPLAPRTPGLREDLDTLVAAVGRAPRRRLRLVVGSAVVVAGLGAGSAAAGVLPVSWFDRPEARHGTVVLSSGHRCQATFAIRPVDGTSEPGTLAAAQEALAGTDVADLSLDAAVRRWRSARRALHATPAWRATPEAERAPEPTGDDLELTALGAEVQARVASSLRRAGLDAGHVSVAEAWSCDD
jgi:hypothetical protein